jgi:hypothetical protein
MVNLQKAILFTTMMVFLLPIVQAFGVTSAYWETNPLTLHPGEEKMLDLELQNMVGGEDMSLLAKITEGAEIATLLGESNKFFVPFGTKDVKVKLSIKLPADALPGETRNVAVSFTQVADDSKGKMIQMVSGVGKKIPVVVVSDEEPGTQIHFGGKVSLPLTTMLIIALILVAAVLVGFFLIRKINS